MFPGMAVPSSPGPTSPSKPEECDVKAQEVCYPEYTKRFGLGIIKDKIEEYKAGKYTEKYIRTYLDFIHLEGIIDNISYLEFKKVLGDI